MAEVQIEVGSAIPDYAHYSYEAKLGNIGSAPTAASRLTKGYLICLSSILFWSTTAIILRMMMRDYIMPPILLAFWRDLITAIALFLVYSVFLRTARQFERRNLRFYLVYGLALAVFNAMWTVSVHYNGAAVATVLVYSSPALTALLSWRLYHEPMGAAKIIALLLSMFGCILTSGAYDLSLWQLNPQGILIGLVSGLGLSAYTLFGKETSQREIIPWTALLYSFFFAAIFLFIFNLVPGLFPAGLASSEYMWLGGRFHAWGLLLILCLGPTIGGYGLYTLSLSYLPAGVANLIATLEPMMTAFWAFLLLGEYLSDFQLIGGGMVTASMIVLRLRDRSIAG